MLRHHVVSYSAAISDFFFLMEENARPLTARFVENFPEAETIRCMEWLAYSSDLNLIEQMWETIRRCITVISRPPVTVQDMEIDFLEWNSIPQSLVDNLVASGKQVCRSFSRLGTP
ncbi:hypothetical protein TNCV_2745911 [Trichonephila clavipes]|nr:hypothetical protein TNCV_2745911 [Trichonephila clavipes]